VACDDYKNRLMGYLDDELDNDQRQQVEKHLAQCPDCAAELEEFKKLKAITDEVALVEPEDRIWRDYWSNIYNRLERSIGWIMFSVAAIALTIYGGFKAVEELIKDPTVEIILKIGIHYRCNSRQENRQARRARQGQHNPRQAHRQGYHGDTPPHRRRRNQRLHQNDGRDARTGTRQNDRRRSENGRQCNRQSELFHADDNGRGLRNPRIRNRRRSRISPGTLCRQYIAEQQQKKIAKYSENAGQTFEPIGNECRIEKPGDIARHIGIVTVEIGLRILALIIDCAIWICFFSLPWVFQASAWIIENSGPLTLLLLPLWFALLAAWPFLYFGVPTGLWGKTLGKLLCRLEVSYKLLCRLEVSYANGARPGLWRGLGRETLKLFSIISLFGALFCAFGVLHQGAAWYDTICGTSVEKTQKTFRQHMKDQQKSQ